MNALGNFTFFTLFQLQSKTRGFSSLVNQTEECISCAQDVQNTCMTSFIQWYSKLYHTFQVINLMYFCINTNITLRTFPLLVKTYHKYGHSDMTRRQNCTICHASHWIITSKTKIVLWSWYHKMTCSPVWSITLIPYNFLNPEQEIKHDILFKRVQDSRTYWRA